ncbi:MAG: NAD kinase [Turicibacter sp.]|nr:NAD kinase [Turicibacter sp.]
MKVTIFANERPKSQKVKVELEGKLATAGIALDAENPDIVFTIGGDGTVLEAVHHYLHLYETVKFIGIHTGHLGYYTDWLPEELDELVDFIQKEKQHVSHYPLLSITLCTGEVGCREMFALNELTLVNARRTQHLNITIDDLFFESFRGTGICCATPTGSTAYNKSLGGALLYPSIEAFQMTEMASINNNVYRTIGSPLIIPKEQVLTIQSENFQDIILTTDHMSDRFDDITEVKVCVSDRKIMFVKRKETLFWERVKQHFL